MNNILKTSKPLRVDAADFNVEVLQSEKPVLVAFSTGWSRACQMLDPVLNEIASSCSETLKVVRINADENPDLGLLYEVQAVPTLLLFSGGEIQFRIVGTASKAAILSKFEAASNATANPRRTPDA